MFFAKRGLTKPLKNAIITIEREKVKPDECGQVLETSRQVLIQRVSGVTKLGKGEIAMLNKMMDNVIKKYGFEHKATIWFCGLVETCTNIAYIKNCYEKLMK